VSLIDIHGTIRSTARKGREGGDFLPGIRVKEGESFESALRRFKKKCEKAGIMADLRRHQHFEKPSERRKRKLNAAKRKNLARRSQES
jgi:small subunit ribosomal protein S21